MWSHNSRDDTLEKIIGIFPTSLGFPESIGYTNGNENVRDHICEQLPESAISCGHVATYTSLRRRLNHLGHIEFRVLQNRRRDSSSEDQTKSSESMVVSESFFRPLARNKTYMKGVMASRTHILLPLIRYDLSRLKI
jgi:hypothetical protein